MAYGHASFLVWHDAILDYDKVADLLAPDPEESGASCEVPVSCNQSREAVPPRQQPKHDD